MFPKQQKAQKLLAAAGPHWGSLQRSLTPSSWTETTPTVF